MTAGAERKLRWPGFEERATEVAATEGAATEAGSGIEVLMIDIDGSSRCCYALPYLHILSK